ARPIVFQEVLFKLAAGAISRAELHRVSAHVGSNQHALGAESGAAALVAEVQADMAAHPRWVDLGLDLENAFGTARRQGAYEHVGEQFKTLEMQGGCCQGGCSATSDFGLAFSAGIRDISEAYSKAFADESSRPRLRLFVGDVCVAAPREHWPQAMRIATQCFAARGLKLRVDKTKAHVPAARSDPALAGELAAELRPRAELDASGLALLGAHAEGECSAHFSFDGATLGPVQKRCEKAIAFASSFKRVAHAELTCRKLGPLWKLVCLVLNRALSYDACVVKPAAFLPCAPVIDLGYERSGMLAAARHCLGRLAASGVFLDTWGMPQPEPDAQTGAHTFSLEHAVAAGVALRHRRKLWMLRAADAALSAGTPGQRKHWLSGGGPEGGLGFTANATGDLAPWSDDEFRINFRRRLRLPLFGVACFCQRRARAGRVCGHARDELGDHAISCMIGGAHNRLHDGVCDELAACARTAGLAATREVVLPELATATMREPRVDVQLWGHSSLPIFHGDFTIVSTHNRRGHSATAGAGATAAEAAKVTKYGARGGTSVQGLALEFGGRHGPQLTCLLQQLASLTRHQSHLRDTGCARPPLRDWRQRSLWGEPLR
ncbi:unnamed protein product, partial [Prorocentrum cordatum]